MSILLKEMEELKLPKLIKVQQIFEDNKLEDLEETLLKELKKDIIKSKIKPGQRIAVAVGSRGIQNIDKIVKIIVNELKSCDTNPYIISAMGSHGNGTEEGQREVLRGYNITEESMGVEIVTTVDVEKIGKTSRGFNVYFDKSAHAADLIIPINRVKLHTDFVGDLQSGLCKMLVIGLGNHIGCSAIHEENPDNFAEILEEAAKMIMEKANVGFGVAILENASDNIMDIRVLPKESLIKDEKNLVKIAKKNMATLMVPEIDVLIVEEIGKDVSGAGYDPNILGKSSVLKKFVLEVPKIKRMVLLDITENSHGNAIGLGMFDAITKNVYEKLDHESTYANAIACKCIEDAFIPIIAKDEEEAIKIALSAIRGIDKENLKIVKIKNTLELNEIYVSEAVIKDIENNKRLKICR